MNDRKRHIIIGAYYTIVTTIGIPLVAIFMEILKAMFGLIVD